MSQNPIEIPNDQTRKSIREQLALITGYNIAAFEKMSDEELIKELEKRYE